MELSGDDVSYEHYLRSYDGRVKVLKVQVSNTAMLDEAWNPRWRRKVLKTKTSWLNCDRETS